MAYSCYPFPCSHRHVYTPAASCWPFVRGIHWWPVDYLHKGPVMQEACPSDDVTCTSIPLSDSRRHVYHPVACYWPFVRGIHGSPVDSPHKGPVIPRHDVMKPPLCLAGAVMSISPPPGSRGGFSTLVIQVNPALVSCLQFDVTTIGSPMLRVLSRYPQTPLQECKLWGNRVFYFWKPFPIINLYGGLLIWKSAEHLLFIRSPVTPNNSGMRTLFQEISWAIFRIVYVWFYLHP